MKSEHGQQLGFREGVEIGKRLTQSSKNKGYFETLLGDMDEIPEFEVEDVRPVMTGLWVGLLLGSPGLFLGIGTSAANLLKRRKG